MAYTVMAYVVMVYIVMTYEVMALFSNGIQFSLYVHMEKNVDVGATRACVWACS